MASTSPPMSISNTYKKTAVILMAFAGLVTPAVSMETRMATIQDYREGISGVHFRNPQMQVRNVQDPGAPDESVLLVDYPASTGQPAERDVWCDAIDKDWSVGSAISFKVKPAQPLRLSVSFLGRNQVAYTSWSDLKGGEWQTVRIALDEIQPNPYFQPPGADKNTPIDVSEVLRIGFAPQSPDGGRLMIGKFIIVD